MKWTAEMQAWLDETMSRATELDSRQVDTVRFAARRAAQPCSTEKAAS